MNKTNPNLTYTATAYGKGGRKLGQSPAFSTRETAVAYAFSWWRKAVRVSSGYGYGGGFHILSQSRREWERTGRASGG